MTTFVTVASPLSSQSHQQNTHQTERMAEDENFHWEPAPDPDMISIPGLNTTAPASDQIEQIDQLITLKLQVSFVGVCASTANLVKPQ